MKSRHASRGVTNRAMIAIGLLPWLLPFLVVLGCALFLWSCTIEVDGLLEGRWRAAWVGRELCPPEVETWPELMFRDHDFRAGEARGTWSMRWSDDDSALVILQPELGYEVTLSWDGEGLGGLVTVDLPDGSDVCSYLIRFTR